MAREKFIDDLRYTSRMLQQPVVHAGRGAKSDATLSSVIDSADLWLSPKIVDAFEAADWPSNIRKELSAEVDAFLTIAKKVPPDKPAGKSLSAQARKHLLRAIEIVRSVLLPPWLKAQKEMIAEATAAATAKGWYVEEDEKVVLESLLGSYKAPRLRIRARDNEVVLDPVACFGSGRQGVVDLVRMPTYETAYLVAFKDDHWAIVSPKTHRSKPFSQTTLVNTITSLAHG